MVWQNKAGLDRGGEFGGVICSCVPPFSINRDEHHLGLARRGREYEWVERSVGGVIERAAIGEAEEIARSIEHVGAGWQSKDSGNLHRVDSARFTDIEAENP